MARIGKREESQRKVVRVTIELSVEETAELNRLSERMWFKHTELQDDGSLVLVFEER